MMEKKPHAQKLLSHGILAMLLFVGYMSPQAQPASAADNGNAHDFIVKVLGRETDLATRLELFPKILDYDEYAPPESSLVPEAIMKFLDYQIAVKVFNVEGVFLMLQGKREKALKILAASYHFGQLMNQTDPLKVAYLVGVAVRAIACLGLQVYTLNCCETRDEFQELWHALEALNRRSRELDTMKLQNLGSPEYIEEATLRHRSADAKFQLVRMAVAAKYRFVTQQEFPQSPQQFAPLLPEGPPKDPFSLERLKFLAGPKTFSCYSVGPDEQDDGASVSYDPTNGTVSRGDIIVEIPREREYPFPRNGVRAATAEELRKQFPNGLPADPFANTRGRPLGISNTTPVYVYSYGPDTDESEAVQAGDRYVPEVHYDPTNGTISEGDLFIAIPSP